jgi:tetratricopeptide (TPR) repeat protein
MPPEQAEGKISSLSRQSDVYALGATLYQLVSGTPPFQGRTPLEILRKVLEEEPIPAHRLQKDVPIDLSLIIQKAMEKDPSRRYATALDLADDLGCFVRGQPVLARAPSLLYRIQKRVRKNPWASGAALMAAACLMGGILLLVQRNQALGREVNALTREAKIRQAMHRVDLARGLVVEAKILTYNREALAEVARLKMDEALRIVDQAVADTPDEPLIHYWRGVLLLDDFQFGPAGAALDRAIHLDPNFTPAFAERGRMHMELAIRAALRRYPVQSKEDRETVLRTRAMPDLKRAMAGEGRTRSEPWREELLKGLLLIAEGDMEGAHRTFQEGFDRHRAEVFLEWLSIVSLSRGQSEEALSYVDRALSIRPHSTLARFQRTMIYIPQGLDYKTPGALENAVDELDHLLQWAPHCTQAYLARGYTHSAMGHPDEALADASKVLEDGIPPELSEAHALRGYVLLFQEEDYKAAVESFTQALSIGGEVSHIYKQRGIAYSDLLEYQQGIKDFNRALELDPTDLETWSNLGLAKIHSGSPTEGIEALNEALRMNPDFSNAYCNRGYGWLALDEIEKAQADFDKALEMDPRLEGAAAPGLERIRAKRPRRADF